jgi:putative ABC transport system permease protein
MRVPPPLPRGVAALIAHLLPADMAEPIAGDLAEEYASMVPQRGRLRAGLAVWTEAVRVTARFRWERAAHGRPLPPIGEELRGAGQMWDSVRQDIVFGLRLFVRQPGFTLVALVALTLGIGANTAIFSLVDAALWRPLPYAREDRIVSLAEQRPREGRPFGPIAPADFFDWRRDASSFAAMAAYMIVSPSGAYNLTGAGEPERVRPLEATPSFLDVLGVMPALGRNFRAEEEIDGRDRVVLLTDHLWRRRFAADPSAVGRTVSINGNAFEIVGVMPPQFWWPTRPDLIVPLALDDHDRTLRGAHFLEAIGRLRDGVTAAAAREELAVIGARLSRMYPDENANHAPSLRGLRESLVGEVRPALLVLMAAVAFVMLIACANVATLLLARASGRQKELSIRRAVGATRARLVRQMLTESVLIALAGGTAGVLVAAWGLVGVRALLPAQFANVPGISAAAIDGRVLLAMIALSTLTGIVFGIVPALVVSDRSIGTALTEDSRGSAGGVRASRIRTVLVTAELALSLVLLAGAALLIVSFYRLVTTEPGFEATQLQVARITLPAARYGGHARTVRFFDRFFERLAAAPAIQGVAATTALPFDGPDSRLNLVIERRPPSGGEPVRAHPRLVSVGYFKTMRIPVLAGRAFTDADAEGAVNVAVLNAAAARQYWPGEDPIGQRISLGTEDDWRVIVGVVADTRHEGLDAAAEPAVFLPQRQLFLNLGTGFGRTMTLIVRANGDAASLTPLVRAAVAGIDPELPIAPLRSMDEVIGDSVAPRRLNFVLVSTFAMVAVVLTAAGLYGVMSYVVAQRTREIGVRMALGATPRQVLGMMFRQASIMTGGGIAIGAAGALLVTRFMTSLLFGVSAADPLVYAGVSALLGLVALAAVAVPSSRATRIDPLAALRDEN